MDALKTGRSGIDDLFELSIKQKVLGYVDRNKSPELQISPSKLYGIYVVAGQQAIYTGLPRRKGKRSATHILSKNIPPRRRPYG
jgi:hypothetical protein